jgi:hypothetical protein
VADAKPAEVDERQDASEDEEQVSRQADPLDQRFVSFVRNSSVRAEK